MCLRCLTNAAIAIERDRLTHRLLQRHGMMDQLQVPDVGEHLNFEDHAMPMLIITTVAALMIAALISAHNCSLPICLAATQNKRQASEASKAIDRFHDCFPVYIVM